MSELEEIRKKKLQQMQMMQSQQGQQQMAEQRQREEMEDQIKSIINQIMLPDARQRLANIRVARPEYARQVEMLLIQLAQSGNLPKKIDDDTLKKLLTRITGNKRETQIKRI